VAFFESGKRKQKKSAMGVKNGENAIEAIYRQMCSNDI